MPPLEPSAGSDGTVDIDSLRERIRVLESGLDWAMNRLGVFETAAAERLITINEGAAVIAELQARVNDLQQRHDNFAAAAEERLNVINHGAQVIADLQAQLRQAQQQHAKVAEEHLEALHRAQDQLSVLETAAAGQAEQLIESQQRFHLAAAEQAELLSQSQDLLRQRDAAIRELSRQLADQQAQRESLEQQLPPLHARIQQLEVDVAERRRGSLELAARERTLTAELLELRNEGLLHSIIRRARTLFS